MNAYMNIAVKAARNASKIIMTALDRLDSVRISDKDRHNFTTNIDLQAEQEIISVLQQAFPDHKILSEEAGEINFNSESDYTWIIDPLDGTTNFIHGLPMFSISIALRYKNKIDQALIYLPAQDEMFTAIRGSGAQLNRKRIRVSQRFQIESNLLGIILHTKSNLSDFLPKNLIQEIKPKLAGIRQLGSATITLAYLASARIDVCWIQGVSIWDLAAGSLLIQEAGGMIADFDFKDNYLESGDLIGANPTLLSQYAKIIKKYKDK